MINYIIINLLDINIVINILGFYLKLVVLNSFQLLSVLTIL